MKKLIELPVVNEQDVAAICEKILRVTDDVANELLLAALADLLGATTMAMAENPDPLIDWASRRAWEWVTTFVKRATPRPTAGEPD